MNELSAQFLLVNLFAVIGSLLLTIVIRQLAIAYKVVDVPNGRSSHVISKPRGGGLAILVVFITAMLTLGDASKPSLALVAAAFITGLIGLVDDIKSQRASVRLTFHLASAIILSHAMGGLPLIDFGIGKINFGWVGIIISTLGVVWMINLTNFMDGVDGLVASQATLSGATIALLILNQEYIQSNDLLLATGLLCSCSLGFLALNRPPASIFMGDVGSGSLGIIFAGLILWTTGISDKWLFVWLIMLGILTVDSTYTLATRFYLGKNLSVGHKTHAYQKALKLLGSHSRVTLISAFISVVWLSPIGYLVATNTLEGFYAMIVAYLPLAGICLWLRAGYD